MLWILFGMSFFVQAQHVYDTTYIKKFQNQSVLSTYSNVFFYNINLRSHAFPDSLDKAAIKYQSESLLRFGMAYAKNRFYIRINFISLLTDGISRKGRSCYFNKLLSLSDKNYLLEARVSWFKGFYDRNTENYTPEFTNQTAFLQNASLVNLSFQVRYMQFSNYRTFTYDGAYKTIAKQKKSAFTWLWYTDVFYNQVKTDSLFIPLVLQDIYAEKAYLKGLVNTGFSAGAGLSGTLVVMKTFYINLTAFAGPGLQYQREISASYMLKKERINWVISGGGKMAFGLDFDTFFIQNTAGFDFGYFRADKLDVTHSFANNTITLGYRFKEKEKKSHRQAN
ncbi:MAG: DUF4421 family protein [Verrucomicrobia bacterium]|nr:DUF4421 family protein [Cytophagales bacterium]